MKLTITIDDQYADEVLDAWTSQTSPLSFLLEGTKEEKMSSALTHAVLAKWQGYRREQTIKTAIQNEVKVTTPVISTAVTQAKAEVIVK